LLDTYIFIATSAFGLEAVVKRELEGLKLKVTASYNGYVEFETDFSGMARANLWLRAADRVLLKLGQFEAATFDDLYENTKALPWAELMPDDAFIQVDGRSVKSTLSSVPACQRIVKKAIVDCLMDKHRTNVLPETGPRYDIEISLQKDQALLTLDTSGVGLHKRGYRELSAAAPIKETLAAALVLLSRWAPHRPFADPLCGSGTIAVEAALIARNMAPGRNREFAAESWAGVDEKIWRDVRTEADDLVLQDVHPVIFASDYDRSVLDFAKHHASRAGVGDDIQFSQVDFAKFHPAEPYGCIVTNPPYGERLGDKNEVERLYKLMGRVLRDSPTWSLFLITSHLSFERLFGKLADKKRKLYNGRIPTQLYQYLGPLPPR